MRRHTLIITAIAVWSIPVSAIAQTLTAKETQAIKCAAVHNVVLNSAIPELLPSSSSTYKLLRKNAQGFGAFVDFSKPSAVKFIESQIDSLYSGMSAAKSKNEYFYRHVDIALACYPRLSAPSR
jgi:hypothetical protein